MKLLFASDSFKGSLSSSRTGQLLASAARQVFGECETEILPMADGGEGTLEAVISAEGGTCVTAQVYDPLFTPREARWGLLPGGRALIEMAAASGLALLPTDKRDPRLTSTFGTGQIIRAALDAGCRDITIAIGGSATNDGGMGCIRALGARLLDGAGDELEGRGGELGALRRIDASTLDPRLKESRVTVMCDVDNPLCGPDGATYTFGPQKGAGPDTLPALEAGMRNYRDIILREYGVDCDKVPGAGAAGGLGAALHVFCNGEMKSGIETVLELMHFDQRLRGVDLVVTGEGRTDSQSWHGKVMSGIGAHARAAGVPVVGLSGSVGECGMPLHEHGISAIITTVNAPMDITEAMARAEELYTDAALNMFRLIKVGMRIQS